MKNWLKIFLIIFIGSLIICWIFAYEIFRWNSFSGNILSIKEWYIYYQAEKKDKTIPCNNLENSDTKILNNSFWIAGFSWWVDYWCNLQTLDIPYDVVIPNFPKEVWKLINLKLIEINETKSKISIPKEIWNLKKLMILRIINSNFLREIPEELYTLNNLKILDLSSRHIEWKVPLYNFSKKIWNLNNLSILKLNKLSLKWEIPKEIWNLKKLLLLDLHWNKLSWKIPEELGQLDNLKVLFLYENNFDNKNLKSNLMLKSGKK